MSVQSREVTRQVSITRTLDLLVCDGCGSTSAVVETHPSKPWDFFTDRAGWTFWGQFGSDSQTDRHFCPTCSREPQCLS